jgi:hypothetical protein
MAGVRLDTRALIGFDGVDGRVLIHLENAERQGLQLTVPTPVVTESLARWRSFCTDRLRAYFPAVRVIQV